MLSVGPGGQARTEPLKSLSLRSGWVWDIVWGWSRCSGLGQTWGRAGPITSPAAPSSLCLLPDFGLPVGWLGPFSCRLRSQVLTCPTPFLSP